MKSEKVAPLPEDEVLDQAMESVGFRLHPDCIAVLKARSKVLGISHHELARFYVVEALLHAEERAALRQSVEALHSAVQVLHGDLGFSVEVLLASAGKVDPEDAKEWAGQNLRHN